MLPLSFLSHRSPLDTVLLGPNRLGSATCPLESSDHSRCMCLGVRSTESSAASLCHHWVCHHNRRVVGVHACARYLLFFLSASLHPSTRLLPTHCENTGHCWDSGNLYRYHNCIDGGDPRHSLQYHSNMDRCLNSRVGGIHSCPSGVPGSILGAVVVRS